MTRSAPLLALLALALAAGAWWITTDPGPGPQPEGLNVERAEGVARAAARAADLTSMPHRSAPASTSEEVDAAPAAPLEVAAGAAPQRTPAGVALHDLHLRLEDDRGEPIQQAKITYNARGAEAETVETSSRNGIYRLEDLAAGEYRVAVDAYILDPLQEPAWHSAPGPDEPILLTFARRASVTGRVIDDAGVAVVGLDVNLVRTNEEGAEERQRAEATPMEGGFQLRFVRPGPVTLTTSNGFVTAELELVLGIGESLEGIDLRLTGGGTVTGHVIDSERQPVVGVDVIIVDTTDFRTKTKTDAEGAFRLGPILPGTYEVTTILKESAKDNVFEQILTQTVTIARGDIIDILLQPKQETPVVLAGRITYAGKPLGDCVVYGFRENEKLLDAVRMARSNDQGEYEMKLGGPGAYLFLFEPRENRSDNPTAPLRAEIPDASEVHMDLAVPASSIRGRVLDADGAPVSGVNVVAVPADDYMDFELPDAQRGVTSNSKGTYRIPYLAEGEYVVRARPINSGSPLAWEPLEGVRVQVGTPTDDVELRATLGGSVRGVVRGPDGPFAGAAIYVHDVQGRLLFLRGATSDAAGAFHIASIPEGEVTLTARAAGLASPPTEMKRLRAGEEASFELRLSPGSLLTATAVDARGAAVSCSIHVLDPGGRDMTRVMTSARAKGSFSDALSTTKKTVGPLPAGEYRVVASTRDGRNASRRVKVDGKRPTEVVVRF